MNVVIIDYGAGNVRSVQYALERLGYSASCSADADVISHADKVIFPGVGEAATAMHEIRAKGLDLVIPGLKQPVLGICLGMQLMCTHSEEGNATGLGIFPVTVERFSNTQKVPHMGWNSITGLHDPIFEGSGDGSYVYFVHSYYVPVNEYTIAVCSYQKTFSAAIRKDNFYGCQFHPEKSAIVGSDILKQFLTL